MAIFILFNEVKKTSLGLTTLVFNNQLIRTLN
jgi:hypothetical protein